MPNYAVGGKLVMVDGGSGVRGGGGGGEGYLEDLETGPAHCGVVGVEFYINWGLRLLPVFQSFLIKYIIFF